MLFISESIRVILDGILTVTNTAVKLTPIGQAIMQTTLPRELLAPLQSGIAVHMHYHFASRFLIDTLYELCFCSSYHETHRFEQSASVDERTDIPEYEDGCVQYAGDNVDHDIRTLNGNDIFHGMGSIATVTPGTTQIHPVSRRKSQP